MKTVRKYMTALLCLCISAYALTTMAASGNVDARFADFRMKDVIIDEVTVRQGVVQAVFANRSTEDCVYTLDRVSADGAVVLESIQSGTLLAGEATIASALSTSGGYFKATIWSESVPGLKSQDTTSGF